jgi:hypothetical protein
MISVMICFSRTVTLWVSWIAMEWIGRDIKTCRLSDVLHAVSSVEVCDPNELLTVLLPIS